MSNKIIVIRKNIHGGLVLSLENINDMGQVRSLTFNDRRPTQRVGIDFALSIFVDPTLLEMYKKGMFIIENEQDFFKQAEEAGIYYDFKEGKKEEKVVADMAYVSEADILSSLKSQNTVALKKKLEDASSYLKSQYLYVAAANVKDITSGNVRIVEEILKDRKSVV